MEIIHIFVSLIIVPLMMIIIICWYISPVCLLSCFCLFKFPKKRSWKKWSRWPDLSIYLKWFHRPIECGSWSSNTDKNSQMTILFFFARLCDVSDEIEFHWKFCRICSLVDFHAGCFFGELHSNFQNASGEAAPAAHAKCYVNEQKTWACVYMAYKHISSLCIIKHCIMVLVAQQQQQR